MIQKILLIILLIFPGFVSSKTTVYSPYIEGLFTELQDGPYDIIFKKIEADGQVDWLLKYVPFNRAITLFEKDPESCIGIGNQQSAADYFGIEAIDIGYGYATLNVVFATQVGQETISSFKQLFNKRIVHLEGESPEQYGFDIPSLNSFSVSNHDQSIRMLMADRVDAIFAASSDLVPFDSFVHYDSNFVVLSTYETLTCKDTPSNRILIEQFGEALKELDLIAE